MPIRKSLETYRMHLVYIYIYIYIYINVFFIKQYRQFLSRHLCISPFELPHWFYDIQRELVNETSIPNWYPSTLCRSWAIIWDVYITKAISSLHIHYYFVRVYIYIYIYIYRGVSIYMCACVCVWIDVDNYIYIHTYIVNQKFCNSLVRSCLWRVYHVTKAIQAIAGTSCSWSCLGSWVVDTLCIASFGVWF